MWAAVKALAGSLTDVKGVRTSGARGVCGSWGAWLLGLADPNACLRRAPIGPAWAGWTAGGAQVYLACRWRRLEGIGLGVMRIQALMAVVV